MPEAPLLPSDTPEIPDLDSYLVQSHDERARTRYTTALLNHSMLNLRYGVWDAYKVDTGPRIERTFGRPAKSGKEIYQNIKTNTFFRTYSSIRYNAQEMGAHGVIDAIERGAPAVNAAVKRHAAATDRCGSLRLNSGMKYPHYLTGMDAHLSPGGYWTERHEGDVSQALLFQVRRLSGPIGNSARDFAGVGASIATYLKRRYPDFRPRRILDMGTQEGKQLYSYGQVFPEAELHGLDIAAPSLRYGHHQAARAGIPIHFSQQNAEHVDYPDGYFDLIVSSFFLHEISVPATKRVIAESYRLLAPGGIMAHMELPPSKSCSPLQNFTFDWDSRFNNEPHYAHFRSQDYAALCKSAGFPAKNTFEITVPNLGSVTPDDYESFMRGEKDAPFHGLGGWFIFGGIK
ncbi:MAG: methyltransferase domain-containing protein [Rhodobacteraceae bacterium]|nr:methyltransferase domain-containing protein [Paracoccaceae bacterium]